MLIAVFLSSLMVNMGFAAPPATAIVSVEPSLVEGLPGDYFTVDITIKGAEDVYAWEIKLQYPPYLATLTVTDVEDGGFLMNGWFLWKDKGFKGQVQAGSTLMGQVPGITGSGVLCRITFFVLEAGEGNLDLISVVLVRRVGVDLFEIPIKRVDNGYYQGPTVDLVRLEMPNGRDLNVGEMQQFNSKIRNDGDVPMYAYVQFEIERLEDSAYMSLGTGQWWYGLDPLPEPWWIDPLDCDGYYVSWLDGYFGVYWNYEGTSPWLDAINDGNYIWADETQDAAMSASYTFEDISLPDTQQIKRVVLEGYTTSTNVDIDLDMYTASPTVFDWLGSLWGDGTWGWHTPRWIGEDASEALPALKTEAGLNSVELIPYHFAPDPVAFAGVMTVDKLRFQVQLEYKSVDPLEPTVYLIEPGGTLELDATTIGVLHDGDIGTYMVKATCWYSYYGTFFNPSNKVVSRSYWVAA